MKHTKKLQVGLIGAGYMGEAYAIAFKNAPDGLAAMKAGELDITVFQNATKQGEVAIEKAIKLVAGDTIENQIWVPFELVVPGNLANYKRQAVQKQQSTVRYRA